MIPARQFGLLTRRQLLRQSGLGFGVLALNQMLLSGQSDGAPRPRRGPPGVLSALHHPPKAKRVIFLFQSGAPSQMDLLDYKPLLNDQSFNLLFFVRSLHLSS